MTQPDHKKCKKIPNRTQTRHYVNPFVDQTRSLCEMVKNGLLRVKAGKVYIDCSEEALRNFNSVKKALSAALLILSSSSEKPILNTYLARMRIGACLTKVDGRPVAFG